MSGALDKIIKIGIVDIIGKNNKGIPINGIAPDYTHGKLTTAVLSSITDDFKRTITTIPVKPRSLCEITSFHLTSLLEQLKKINLFGKDFDFLNISGSWPIKYDIFGLQKNGAELSGKEVQRDVMQQLKQVIKSEAQGEMRIAPEEVVPIIDELERISKNGTEIFISSCNKADSFNAFSLAKGIHTIGGKDGKTGKPIERFSHNPLVEEYVNLPLYIIQKLRAHKNAADKTFMKLGDNITIESDIAKVPVENLKIASDADYKIMETVVNDLYARKKFNFDIDFLRFKFVSAICKKYIELTGQDGVEQLKNKIFDIRSFLQIFKGKFDSEVLEFTHPKGTHCDLLFRQFLNMNNRLNHIIPLSETTEVTNTLSGTSFAAPQGLANALKKSFQ